MLASYHELAATGAAGTGLVGSCAAPPLPASLRATASKMADTLAAVLADVSMKSMEFLQESSHVMPLHAAGKHPTMCVRSMHVTTRSRCRCSTPPEQHAHCLRGVAVQCENFPAGGVSHLSAYS